MNKETLFKSQLMFSIETWLGSQGLPSELVFFTMLIGKVLFLIFLNLVILIFIRRYGLPLWKKIILALPIPWGESLLQQSIEIPLYRFIPILIVYNFADSFDGFSDFISKICYAYYGSTALILSPVCSMAFLWPIELNTLKTENPCAALCN